MATEIVWTQKAKSWLHEIYDYIALDNEEAAWNTIQGIYRKAETLIDNPNIGYRHEIDELPDHIRIILYGHYRIAYFYNDEDKIFILGVYHSALDIRKHISQYD